MNGFWYLAAPYSRAPRGIYAAWHDACRAAALLVRAGLSVFSPISHSHPIALDGDIDTMDGSLWIGVDRPMMDAAIGIIVLMAPSWERSVGICEELRVFREAGKPIIYMRPGEVPVELVETRNGGEQL